jgi:arabinogalactan endo-1,4-beta-galactosidase
VGSGGAGGGSETGGSTSSGGTSGTGGTSALPFSYFIGADITWVQADEARGATFVDGDPQDVLQILKSHGFNAVRLRTFVDPRAADGYDKQNGNADLAHTISFGKRIKAAGMGLLVDFHYSDNWADPGKQCVPIAWQGLTTVQELARAVHDYTKNAVSELLAGGARPDLVQIGNEITPGMLLHVCDAGGQPTGSNRVTGSSNDFANLGELLKAGIRGVKEVDTSIPTMLHIDRCNDFGTSRWFIDGVLAERVEFEVFGESCYQAYQGTPGNAQATKSAWSSTLSQLVARYPKLKFVAAEYGPMQREINDVMFGLPNQQGAGTFNWEPTHPGAWNTGHALFTAAGDRYTATADLMLYDAMRATYAARL